MDQLSNNQMQVENVYVNIPTSLIADLYTSIPQLSQLEPFQIQISTNYNHNQLNDILNQLLRQTAQIAQQTLQKYSRFQFLIEGTMLRGQVKSHLVRWNIACQKNIQIEYFTAFEQVQHSQTKNQEDWVSRIEQILHQDGTHPFAVSLFSGAVSIYNNNRMLLSKQKVQQSIIKSIKTLPTQNEGVYYLISGGIDQDLRIHSFYFNQMSELANSKKKSQSSLFNFVSSNVHGGPISSIEISPMLDGLFCSVGDKSLNIWKIPQNFIDSVNQVKIKNKKRLVQTKKIKLQAKQNFEGQTIINTCHWSSNNEVIIGSMDHSMKIVNIQKMRVLSKILTKDSITTSIHTCQSSVLSSHQDGYIRLWDQREPNRPALTYKSHSKLVSQVQFNPRNSSIFVSGSYDHSVKVWDIRSIFPLQSLDSHSDKVFSVFWRGQKQIASGGSDSKIDFHCI